MSALANHSLSTHSSNHLRPFDSHRDLGAVADLVELCFADTLDESGRGYVQRMRQAARSNSLFGWTNMSMGGFVWDRDGRVVGNVNLIPFTTRGNRNFLVANVAVHPACRRQGIARSLTNQAVERGRQLGMKSVWLHVREENEAAVSLYQSLGFAERLRRTSWLSGSELPGVDKKPGVTLSSSRGRDWELQLQWLSANYPPEVTWQSAMSFDALRPGFIGALYRFLYSLGTLQWSAWVGNRLAASVSWQASFGSAHSLWLASPPDADENALRLLLLHARRQVPSHRPLEFDFPAGQSRQAIAQAGFTAQQTLIWMELPL
jgi:ribosomal protein S18 acetylase RimI-like enzyme